MRNRTAIRTLLLPTAILSVGALTGCPAPVDAPTDLDELGAYLFTEFERSEEVGAREAGLANLAAFYESTDLGAGYLDRATGSSLSPPTRWIRSSTPAAIPTTCWASAW